MLPAAPFGAPSDALSALVGHGCGPAAVVAGTVVVLVGLVVVAAEVGWLVEVAVVLEVPGPVWVVDVVALADLCDDDPHAAKAAPATRTKASLAPTFTLNFRAGSVTVLTASEYPSGRESNRALSEDVSSHQRS